MSHPSELIRDGLRRLFAAYMPATGATVTEACLRFAKDRSFLARLDQHKPSVRKASAIVHRFSEAWPENAEWPEGLPPRPLDPSWTWSSAATPSHPSSDDSGE